MNIHVGNLDTAVTEEMIRELFARFGEVGKVTLMQDRRGISKGFGFVEMPAADAGSRAIQELNRTMFQDRTLDITESQPRGGKGYKPPRPKFKR
jgi:RNA recognition motif-containing protein